MVDDKKASAGAASLLTAASVEPGFVLDGSFEILEKLGSGGMGVVYKAQHLVLKREVAIKVLHPEIILDLNAVKRLQREAQAIGTLDHPNIIKVFSFGCVNNKLLYFVMEYLEGRTLADLIKLEGRLSKERAVPIFRQILSALSHAHSKGIVHRDLKPTNVMLTGPDDTVKLIDFGIAKVLPESGKQMQQLTQTGHLVGTVIYMSPEQLECKPVDTLSDIYSMGCLMFETLDGHPPVVSDNVYSAISQQVHDKPRQSDYLNDDLGAVVMRSLEKDPQQRPRSANTLERLLLSPSSLDAKPHVVQPSKPVSGSKLIYAGLLVSAICIAAISVQHASAPEASDPPDPLADIRGVGANVIFDKAHDSMFDAADWHGQERASKIQYAKTLFRYLLTMNSRQAIKDKAVALELMSQMATDENQYGLAAKYGVRQVQALKFAFETTPTRLARAYMHVVTGDCVAGNDRQTVEWSDKEEQDLKGLVLPVDARLSLAISRRYRAMALIHLKDLKAARSALEGACALVDPATHSDDRQDCITIYKELEHELSAMCERLGLNEESRIHADLARRTYKTKDQ